MAKKKSITDRKFFELLVHTKKNGGDVYDLARQLAFSGHEMPISLIRSRVNRLNNKYCEHGRIMIKLRMKPTMDDCPYVGYDEWKNAAYEIRDMS